MDQITEYEIAAYISRALSENPGLLSSALRGITQGMEGALAKANEQAALKDQATLAVMALTNGRVGKDLRETLLAKVVAAIHPANACGFERGYIDQHATLRKASPEGEKGNG